MKNKISVKRMVELEEVLNSKYFDSSFKNDEKMYLKRARKMPFNIMIEVINYYKKRWYFIDEVEFENKLQSLFHVTEEELRLRLKEVHLILRYKNKQMDNLLLEQKKMVKTIKNMN